jgi:hypothetical protein
VPRLKPDQTPLTYPREMVSDAAFWSICREWWPLNGGLPEELRTLERLAADRRVTPAAILFRMVRKMISQGGWD